MSYWPKRVAEIAVCMSFISSLGHSSSGSAVEEIVAIAANPVESSAVPGSAPASVAVETLTPANNREILERMHADLATAQAKAASLASYTATLEMQEEVNGSLRPLDSIQIKIRQEPFSVYMRWNESTQEALFVDGKNDNRVLVKPTKALAALKRLWRLDPDSRMAKQNSRHPITSLGIEKLVKRVQEFYAVRDDWSAVAECRESDADLAGVAVRVYDVRFRDKEISPLYLSGRYCIDKSTGLLIVVDNFGWSDGQEPCLLEHYAYHTINQTVPLEESDFDEKNSEYEFVER